jgi:hypothetical protein
VILYILETKTEEGWSDDPALFGNTNECNRFATRRSVEKALKDCMHLWPDSEFRIQECEEVPTVEDLLEKHCNGNFYCHWDVDGGQCRIPKIALQAALEAEYNPGDQHWWMRVDEGSLNAAIETLLAQP